MVVQLRIKHVEEIRLQCYLTIRCFFVSPPFICYFVSEFDSLVTETAELKTEVSR